MIVAFKLSCTRRMRMKMTAEGRLQGGGFGSKAGWLEGQALERTGPGGAELLLAGDGYAVAVDCSSGYCKVPSVPGLC